MEMEELCPHRHPSRLRVTKRHKFTPALSAGTGQMLDGSREDTVCLRIRVFFASDVIRTPQSSLKRTQNSFNLIFI